MTDETLVAENAVLRKNMALLEQKIGELRKVVMGQGGPADDSLEIANLRSLVGDQCGVIDLLRKDCDKAQRAARENWAALVNLRGMCDAATKARDVQDEDLSVEIGRLNLENARLKQKVDLLKSRLKPDPQLHPWVSREALLQRIKELEGDLKTAIEGKRQACEAHARTKAAGRAPYEREVRRLRARLRAFKSLLETGMSAHDLYLDADPTALQARASQIIEDVAVAYEQATGWHGDD